MKMAPEAGVAGSTRPVSLDLLPTSGWCFHAPAESSSQSVLWSVLLELPLPLWLHTSGDFSPNPANTTKIFIVVEMHMLLYTSYYYKNTSLHQLGKININIYISHFSFQSEQNFHQCCWLNNRISCCFVSSLRDQ